MAEDLVDGEFWLPSQFLDDNDDDDILTDFTSGSSDDESALTGPFSPQSTLLGCQPGSSVGTPTDHEVVQARKDDDNNSNSNNSSSNSAATLELLNKAAGEVAKIKLFKSDNNIRSATASSNGTGFFDCSRTSSSSSSKSAQGILCPPPLSQRTTTTTAPYFPPQFYSHSHPHFPHFPPHMMWGPAQLPPHRAITKNNKSNVDGRPLGLPQSAWPTLPGQAQAQPQAKPMLNAFVGPQRDSVGTGVFLPRRVTTPTDPKKKSDGNVMKTKNNKGSQRRSARPTKAFDDEIKLPSEWVY